MTGDPTEAALVVLAAKIGIDAEETRRTVPRRALVPFDSQYKFMATFHRVPDYADGPIIELVKGGPDVLLDRSSYEDGIPLPSAPGETASALERRIRELETSLRGAAHDLRSPLVSVLGFTRLLRDEFGDPIGRTGRHFLDRIEQAGQTWVTLDPNRTELKTCTIVQKPIICIEIKEP